MVDLPQHEAIVSIMLNLHNRNFNFDSYYNWAPARTLYIAPYVMGFALSHFMSVSCAMHIIVFCAVLSYLIGILLCLRALSRPAYLGLLAMPFVYNQSFYWGFVNFNLAIGLAFIALSLLIGNWSNPQDFPICCGLNCDCPNSRLRACVIGVLHGPMAVARGASSGAQPRRSIDSRRLGSCCMVGIGVERARIPGVSLGGPSKSLVQFFAGHCRGLAGQFRSDIFELYLCNYYGFFMADRADNALAMEETEPSSAGSLGIHKHTLGSLFQHAGVACRGQQGQFSPRRNGGTCTTTYRGFRGRECSLYMVTFGSHCFGLGGNGQQLVPLQAIRQRGKVF